MIVGIGTDVVDIRRISAILERRADAFITRLFTAEEQQAASGRRDLAAFYAKRFAAKEAGAKAIGCGLWRDGVTFTDFSVRQDGSGQPLLSVRGRALDKLRAKIPQAVERDLRPVAHLSLSDEDPLAVAFVVISLESGGVMVR